MSALTWTTTPPDRPGWWWMQSPVGAPFIVHCMAFYDDKRMRFWDGPKAELISSLPDDYRFAGPIEEPTEASA